MDGRARHQLRQDRDRLASLHDDSPAAYFTFDEAGRVLDVNRTGASLLATDRQALVGVPFIQWVDESEREFFAHHLRECIDEQWHATAELILCDATGRRIPVLIGSRPEPRSSVRGVRSVMLVEPAAHVELLA